MSFFPLFFTHLFIFDAFIKNLFYNTQKQIAAVDEMDSDNKSAAHYNNTDILEYQVSIWTNFLCSNDTSMFMNLLRTTFQTVCLNTITEQ